MLDSLFRNFGKSVPIYIAKRRFTGLILTVISLIQTVSYKTSKSKRYLCDVLVKFLRRYTPSALSVDKLSIFQALLHVHVARGGLFVKQVKSVPSEGCGLKGPWYFQATIIFKSDKLGEDFQLQYSYVT
jgi:hypothetical protein